jgi:surface polysaccharide O-acyltransferase-like enzyme
MASGVFMLDPVRPVGLSKLLRGHIFPVVLAYFAWGIIYYLPSGKSLIESLNNVLFFNAHYHLGFLQYLLGLYLLTPVLRGFVAGAGKREWAYFFCAWIIVSGVFPLLQRYAPEPVMAWFQTVPNKINFNFFMNYTGFYLAGYWLNREKIAKNKRIVLYVLGILGGLWTVIGTRIVSAKSGHLVESFYEYGSLNVILLSVTVFVFVKNFTERAKCLEKWRRPIAGAAACVFGVYLSHDLWIWLFFRSPIHLFSMCQV